MSAMFQSFWMGGFESACHINRAGRRLDMICASGHDVHVAEDYERLRRVGIRTVREGLRWHLIDAGRRGYDFSSVRPFIGAAEAMGMQVIWNLCHYGWPDDIDILAPAFVTRFAKYAGAVARLVADCTDAVPFYSLVNEISFFSWAAGEVGYIFPHDTGSGGRVKAQLVRATIAGIEAIRLVDPRARFLHADPVIHVVPPRDRPDLARVAADQREAQFEAWDMLAGGYHPELGGRPEYLDIVGANFYYANQWEYPGRRLAWHARPRDDRWRPLSALLADLQQRYQRPIIVAETGHFGAGRAEWLREVAAEVRKAQAEGVRLEGVCLYPILDRPDWDDPAHWHRSGLWDVVPSDDGVLERVIDEDYAAALAIASRAARRSYASSASRSVSSAGEDGGVMPISAA